MFKHWIDPVSAGDAGMGMVCGERGGTPAATWGEVTCPDCRAEIRYGADPEPLAETEKDWATLDAAK